MINCRKETVKLLDKTFKENCYSNLLLDGVLSSVEVSLQDRKFITNLYYGVLERKITLDYIISSYSSRPVKKLDMTVLNILRTGLYQICYMDSIPDTAAVNESVKLAKAFKLSSASGFINAVMRNFIRSGSKISESDKNIECLSVRYSVNKEIISMLISDYGLDFSSLFLERSLEKTPVYIRLNNVLSNENELISGLGKIEAVKSEILSGCYKLSGGNLTQTEAFKKGYFHVQDISSQFACAALNPSENEKVVDVCSAPGGKTFTIAEMMNNTGTVFASDIYEHRTELISSGANRLGLKNVKAVTADASVHNPEFEGADKVLCDVPCSGVGVIRKKPEIRYKSVSDFNNLPELQYKILENAASYLKENGELVYSTCTLNKRENEDVVNKFLNEHHEFEGVPVFTELGAPFGNFMVTLGADKYDSDGFFISKIRRKFV